MEKREDYRLEKRILLRTLLVLMAMTILLSGCSETSGSKEYEITDVEIFKETPVWELAEAVNKQSISMINQILSDNADYIDYQEPKYGATLLMWSIGMEKYDSAKTLLEFGADPNIATTDYGETPLYRASEYSWVDNSNKKDPKYVELLLSYNANPNIAYIGLESDKISSVVESGTSPLMNSIGSGIEKTKALVEAGAEINYKTKYGSTAAMWSLLKKQDPQYAYYLIVEKKATITEPFYDRFSYSEGETNKEFYLVDLLRQWIFDLDSEEYQIKMEIVEEFERQGVNYWDTPISDRTLEQIKKLYPETWKEYILKY